ncbi:arylsulfatase [Planctomyces sp. SH-PL14]|uniref:arylsulfatase n=1 Tax=Planctomyces sp. SH-PL14 TaxID=1632864 RepID=UPI00078CF080|nr:arylsulfatase [Planctomyces sp. SH-PL14]AMV17744.1 Arylsulfatase [Planctomyces sp. SH-PL14]
MLWIVRTLSVVAALLICDSGGGAPADAAETPRPNVLILFADDLGYSDLGCYGGEIETPNLDRLAAGGLRFTQFYNTARCWPSRAALMTGYYAQQVRRDTVPGVKSGGQGTRPGWAPLLPARLRPLGYRSYHSGKWHIDGKPLENGFDHSFQLEDHNSYFHPANILVDGRKIGPDHRWSDQYCTVSIADHAVECLQEHAARFSGQPFFYYVAFTSPHFPLQALPEDIARYKEKYRAGWEAIRGARYERQKRLGLVAAPLSAPEADVGPPYDFPEALQKLGPGEVNRPLPWKDLTPEQQAFQADKMAVHAAMIDRMDREIGRILEQLTVMGAAEETLILFASDNGASAEIMVRGGGHDPQAPPGSDETYLCLGPGWSTCANTPFRRHKTWVHEGGIATPLIVHWPRGIRARDELRTAPGHLIDVVPTVLALAGAGGEQPAVQAPALPGRSLLPLFEANAPLERPPLWWLHEGNRALREGDWKIVAAKGDEWSLYDLAADRTETVDLAKREPRRLAEMRTRWDALTEEFRRNATQDLPSK